LKFRGGSFERLQANDLFVPQKIRFADHHHAASDAAQNTPSRHRTEVFHGFENKASLPRARHDRGSEGMFTVLLQRGGET